MNPSTERSIRSRGILLDKIGLAPMACREVEVAFLDEEFFYAGQHLGGVAVAQFGHKNANRKRLALAKRPRIETRAIIEFSSSFGDTVARLLGDGAHAGGVVQDERDSRRRKVEILAKGAQADGLARL